MATLREFRSNRSGVMCDMFQCNVGESDEMRMMLTTLARRELEAAWGHMDRMLQGGDETEAFGHLVMMLEALRAVRRELV